MTRKCLVCPKTFQTFGRGHNRVTCSTECHREKKRQQIQACYFRKVGKPIPPPKPKVRLSESQKGYIAGILDGEGWIGITIRKRAWKRSKVPHYHRPVVSVSQVKRPVLDHLMDILGHKDVSFSRLRHVWELRLHPPCLKWLLPQILDCLVLKRQQAEILLKFMARCHYNGKELTQGEWEEREALYLKLRRLNAKPGTARKLQAL